MSSKLVAIVLAGVAVVLAGVAVIVVATRHAPASLPATIDTRTVAARDVVQLGDDPQVTFDLQGAHVGDAALSARLGLLPGDTIVALSGLPMLQARDFDHLVFLNAGEIYVDLVRAGSAETVRWRIIGDLREARRQATPSPASISVAPPPSAPDPLLDTIVRDDDTHFHVPRATVEAMLADPMKYATQARVVPAIANGVPAGFKLYAIRPNSLLARLGFQNGDRLDAIDGTRLDSADAALEAYTKLRHAVRLDVSVTRRNQPMEIMIAIN